MHPHQIKMFLKTKYGIANTSDWNNNNLSKMFYLAVDE